MLDNARSHDTASVPWRAAASSVVGPNAASTFSKRRLGVRRDGVERARPRARQPARVVAASPSSPDRAASVTTASKASCQEAANLPAPTACDTVSLSHLASTLLEAALASATSLSKPSLDAVITFAPGSGAGAQARFSGPEGEGRKVRRTARCVREREVADRARDRRPDARRIRRDRGTCPRRRLSGVERDAALCELLCVVMFGRRVDGAEVGWDERGRRRARDSGGRSDGCGRCRRSPTAGAASTLIVVAEGMFETAGDRRAHCAPETRGPSPRSRALRRASPQRQPASPARGGIV